eukprot:CAMPEP_0181327170 /NCGR_PEP_ID=MMETSP1101-20121128/21940_1 /TAXON_ID=46948 /ORGANISM="Rhodomonas abbreviata, Strain Caron Lab Isolate" /LENGTH=279 /DNA_ID=CAMNT_0023435775 /DNA_START=341 /DNA_END=1181 /DNA_ORIENTATION=-
MWPGCCDISDVPTSSEPYRKLLLLRIVASSSTTQLGFPGEWPDVSSDAQQGREGGSAPVDEHESADQAQARKGPWQEAGDKESEAFHARIAASRQAIRPSRTSTDVAGEASSGEGVANVRELEHALRSSLARLENLEDTRHCRLDKLKNEAIEEGLKIVEYERKRSEGQTEVLMKRIQFLSEELDDAKKHLSSQRQDYEELLEAAKELSEERDRAIKGQPRMCSSGGGRKERVCGLPSLWSMPFAFLWSPCATPCAAGGDPGDRSERSERLTERSNLSV